ncbi:MAG: hydrogenase formation protein HypD [Thermodesulfobacteriota bacterium]
MYRQVKQIAIDPVPIKEGSPMQNEYGDPDVVERLARGIRDSLLRPVRLMEVCGTHTVSVFRHGIRSLLPPEITLVSGPGCPVCVTTQADLGAFMGLSAIPGAIAATFGDLLRVPGTQGSLMDARASGLDVRIVYSPSDAVTLARNNPDRPVVFFAVGFETTAPAVAAALKSARQSRIANFFIYPAMKLVPPALSALLGQNPSVDGLILPGHVCVILGTGPFHPLAQEFRLPMTVTGFEAADILLGIRDLVAMISHQRFSVTNSYLRAVSDNGNPVARALMNEVFTPAPARWRGLGEIPGSGLALHPEYSAFDAASAFHLRPGPEPDPGPCRCADILTARATPPDCPLFATACTPAHPHGPCMVSSEGTCAAFFRYQQRKR